MKRVLIVLAMLALYAGLGSHQLLGQDMSILEEVAGCIREGNSDQLSTFLNENVEITLMDQRNDYAKSQAKYILKDFFTTYPPASFSLLHDGNTGGTIYALGEYESGGLVLEVNIFLKSTGDGYLIDQIRFERK
jgi:hypothetical protein